jgi:hypothetical protein
LWFNYQLFIYPFITIIISFSFSNSFKPSIAVISFYSYGVSKKDAQVIFDPFGTSQIMTISFNLIEQEQINEILAIQTFKLTAYIGDACSIEIEQQYAAGQIILGEISSLRGNVSS